MRRFTISKTSSLRFLVVFALTLPLIYWSRLWSYDINDYERSFHGETNRYELGFNAILNLAYGPISFETLWLFLVSIEAVLLASIFKRSNALLFLPFPFLYVFDFVYGNQIRWGLATLLIIKFSDFRVSVLPSYLIHQISPLIYLIKVTLDRIWIGLAISILVVVIFAQYSSSILFSLGYSYYVDSYFLDGRSVQSLIFSILVGLVGLINWKLLSQPARLAVVGHVFSIVTFQYAIVAGRLIDAIAILEAFLLYDLYKRRDNIVSLLAFIAVILLQIVRLYYKWL